MRQFINLLFGSFCASKLHVKRKKESQENYTIISHNICVLQVSNGILIVCGGAGERRKGTKRSLVLLVGAAAAAANQIEHGIISSVARHQLMRICNFCSM